MNDFELLQATNVWETHGGDALVRPYPYLGVLANFMRHLRIWLARNGLLAPSRGEICETFENLACQKRPALPFETAEPHRQT